MSVCKAKFVSFFLALLLQLVRSKEHPSFLPFLKTVQNWDINILNFEYVNKILLL